ncbi:hypothetical protein K3152_08695 [Qipengyuania sp. 1NDH17]|uniref:Uncharacterized protein n=2 Tax=Qipengyuania polymorpha TaxID=2867234 RepID=A0ABS7J1F8_9SPHN|nr:hypothetical protein [Qipengyuania polymorpha]
MRLTYQRDGYAITATSLKEHTMSKKTYTIDAVSLQSDPDMSDLFFHPGSHTAAHESETGQAIHNFLTSRLGVAVLLGSVVAAPSRPPVIATEPFVAKLVGDAAFTDEMKKYAGRVVRQIIEHLGGQWVRRGVKVTVPSRYGSGSIYTFGGKLALEVAT